MSFCTYDGNRSKGITSKAKAVVAFVCASSHNSEYSSAVNHHVLLYFLKNKYVNTERKLGNELFRTLKSDLGSLLESSKIWLMPPPNTLSKPCHVWPNAELQRVAKRTVMKTTFWKMPEILSRMVIIVVVVAPLSAFTVIWLINYNTLTLGCMPLCTEVPPYLQLPSCIAYEWP